jgi:hypothetical protein
MECTIETTETQGKSSPDGFGGFGGACYGWQSSRRASDFFDEARICACLVAVKDALFRHDYLVFPQTAFLESSSLISDGVPAIGC